MASSSMAEQTEAYDSDINSNRNTRSSSVANSSGGKVGSKYISDVGEAEQYARTAHHVWKRFGARAWETGVSNDEARALYHVWT